MGNRAVPDPAAGKPNHAGNGRMLGWNVFGTDLDGADFANADAGATRGNFRDVCPLSEHVDPSGDR